MQLTETQLPGCYLITCQPLHDERGYFARTWCAEAFTEQTQHPAPSWVQGNISYNRNRGTLRGLHYQAAPHGEEKLVSCIRGSVYDVLLDLRPNAPTHGQWMAVTLSEDTPQLLFIPQGVAHGFLTLAKDTTLSYQMSTPYVPTAARGIRWNDPAFAIPWPEAVAVISEKDQQWPLWDPTIQTQETTP
jgi:dTDP-4-dehydrorhamnose 3,5-epimerase